MSRGSRVRSPPGVFSACSVMVIIGASQALDPGSIPGRGRWPPELRWQSGRLLTDRSLVRSQVVAITFLVFICYPQIFVPPGSKKIECSAGPCGPIG